MAKLIIANAPQQVITTIIDNEDITVLSRYNLTSDMFGPYKEHIERIQEYYNQYGHTPGESTIESWWEENILTETVEPEEEITRQLQIDYFYTHSFNKMLNRTIDNVQIDPEQAMKEMAEFCRANQELIYGRVKSHRYQRKNDSPECPHLNIIGNARSYFLTTLNHIFGKLFIRSIP